MNLLQCVPTLENHGAFLPCPLLHLASCLDLSSLFSGAMATASGSELPLGQGVLLSAHLGIHMVWTDSGISLHPKGSWPLWILLL